MRRRVRSLMVGEDVIGRLTIASNGEISVYGECYLKKNSRASASGTSHIQTPFHERTESIESSHKPVLPELLCSTPTTQSCTYEHISLSPPIFQPHQLTSGGFPTGWIIFYKPISPHSPKRPYPPIPSTPLTQQTYLNHHRSNPLLRLPHPYSHVLQ